MKKILSILMALTMVLGMSTTAFAAEQNVPATVEETGDIQARGSLSGSNSAYVSGTSSNTYENSFNVNVSGIPWFTAKSQFSVSGFNSNVQVNIWLYYPDGTLAWDTASYLGTYLVPGNTASKSISGKTGNYTVRYKIYNPFGSIPSGTISCSIT